MNERENAGEREKERADKTEIDGMTEMKKEEGNVRERQTDRQRHRERQRLYFLVPGHHRSDWMRSS